MEAPVQPHLDQHAGVRQVSVSTDVVQEESVAIERSMFQPLGVDGRESMLISWRSCTLSRRVWMNPPRVDSDLVLPVTRP